MLALPSTAPSQPAEGPTPETENFSSPSTDGDRDEYVSVESYNNLLEAHASLEQQLAAAVMALEDGALVFADTKWAASVRETLAAIKETDSSAEPKS